MIYPRSFLLSPKADKPHLQLHHQLSATSPRMTINKNLKTAKVWPTQAAGPDNPSFPLSAPLLRLIPGCPRFQRPPLAWLQPDLSVQADFTQFFLTANLSHPLSSKQATIPLFLNGVSKPADSRFDFVLPSVSDSSHHVSFRLSSTSLNYHGSLLLSEIPRDAGIIYCSMYDVNDRYCTPAIRLRLTYSHMSSHRPSLDALSNQLKNQKQETFIPKLSGHRGMGSSGPNAPWRVLENSLESFLMAAHSDDQKSVSAVELDVQLTRDGCPVIYHDWFFHPLDSYGNPMYDQDAVRLPINSLTFSQFDKLLQQSYGHTENNCDSNITDGIANVVSKGDQIRNIAANRGLSADFFKVKARTLSNVCDMLPTDIGLLVELKYPAPDLQESLRLPYPTRDEFVNSVLDDLSKSKHGDREIAFLCFEPDVCDMLRSKQGKYAVYLSHCEAIDKPCDEFDPRTVSLRTGLAYVKSYGLDGIMMLNELVTLKKDVIQEIVKERVPILTYGKSNSDWEFVKEQFDAGVGGVIADDVDILVADLRERKLL